MRTNRRGLLAVAAGGIVAAAPAAAWGPLDALEAAKRKRCVCVPAGEFEKLDRKVEDLKAQVRGLTARLTNMGFSPGTLQVPFFFDDTDPSPEFVGVSSTATEFLVPFSGSIIALSVIAESNYAGAAGSNYNDFEVYVDGVATGLSVQIAGGSRSAYAVQAKGDDLFLVGSRIQLQRTKTGSPVPSVINHMGIIWVSFN